ncbi:galactosylceramide sulfotransferase-like [Glandiceps talaboti]
MKMKGSPRIQIKHNATPSIKQSCQPNRKFVYFKIQKTGGSTLATLAFRYGLKHNLVAAVAQGLGPHIYLKGDRLKIHNYTCDNFPGYNYIANHIHYRYNRIAVEKVIKNGKYFTMLRSPLTRTKSAFYYLTNKNKNYRSYPNPFSAFLENCKRQKDETCDREIFNHQFNFFGGHLEKADDTLIQDILEMLNRELDLVMLTEYYDESLVLLRKIMCWEYEDMVYSSRKIHRGKQPPTTPEMEQIIRKFSPLDLKIHEYFNKTFWEKVKGYDGNFEEDLARLRSVQKNAKIHCQGQPKSKYCGTLVKDTPRIMKDAIDKQKNWDC